MEISNVKFSNKTLKDSVNPQRPFCAITLDYIYNQISYSIWSLRVDSIFVNTGEVNINFMVAACLHDKIK